ncbi:aspartyl protease family protein [Tenacibaculum xiamenense]|uniref:aspartyl protease family protein n=1 Tax=Tenacibaculum xiamenense TaxID=1261553 RepID=UPI003893E790
MKSFFYFLTCLFVSIQGYSQEEIHFEISEYNLLFTTVEINNKKYKALIDFGDFAKLQLSTKLITKLGIKTEKSDIIMSDINGNQYALEKGIIKKLKIDKISENNIEFFSAKNEIESVSKQVGTIFEIVIGFGYFKNKNFILNFKKNKIQLYKKPINIDGFNSSINSDYGYLISEFKSTKNETFRLLFDTGTPVSKLDNNSLNLSIKDSTVTFQNTQFPSRLTKVTSNNKRLCLNMESANLEELKPLNVNGIFGVNDMLGKIFIYNNENNSLKIISNTQNLNKIPIFKQ